MSSGKQVSPPTQWETETFHRNKHLLLEPALGRPIWDELAPYFDSRQRAKQVTFFELYRGDSYVGTTLQNMHKEVNYLIARVAAAESSSRDQIRQEIDAAIYK